MITDIQFEKELEIIIENSIREDVGDGDHSSLACIPKNVEGKAQLLVKDSGIIAGVDFAERVFKHVEPSIKVNVLIKSSLGAGAWDAVANNFSKFANITLGSAGAIVNIIILAFIILYNKKIKFLFVIVPIIGIALATDFWDIIVFGDYVPTEYWLKLIFFVVGTAILSFGLTSIIISTFPAMVYDELTIAFMKTAILKIN